MDLLRAFLIAFLPIGGLTFLVTYLSYRHGDVTIADDKSDDDDWGFTASDTDVDDRPTNNYLHQKWMSFGGGYYGLMALMTFAVIELRQVLAFVDNFEGWRQLLSQIDIDFLVDFFVDQLMNFIDAMVWFTYWPDYIQMGNGWAWLGLSYAGFYVGHWLAETTLSKS